MNEPDYRLYTNTEAAERAGGGLTESFFRRLAASGEVESTLVGGKTRWTDAQIRAAIAHHAKGGKTTSQKAPAPAAPASAAPANTSRRTQRRTPQPGGNAETLRPAKGRKYATA